MRDQLLNLKNSALAQLSQVSSPRQFENLKLHYLGKSGQLAQAAKQLAALSPEEKRVIGPLFNEVRSTLRHAFNQPLPNHQTEKVDLTLPGLAPPLGHLHPVTYAIEEISSLFEKIGFVRVRYFDVEWDWFAFESLNEPPTHPARDELETFYVDAPADPQMGKMVLSPHTSSGQTREMLRVGHPPIRMINIAKCYRRQSDLTHTVMFHQFEGLVIDQDINISHLKGTIDYFAKNFFGPDRSTRLRPYHFQFTEPSFEVDVSCDICQAQGCKLCKDGWLELGGAGMVHPTVLKNGKIDPEKYTGFAFGWGVERTYLMKSGLKIPDLRLLYSNDIRFLHQF